MASENPLGRHVRAQRKRLDWTVADAEVASGAGGYKISGSLFNRFENDGHLTKHVRKGVAAAFGWPQNWPEDPPPLSDWSNALDGLRDLTRRIAALEDAQAETRELVQEIAKQLGAAPRSQIAGA